MCTHRLAVDMMDNASALPTCPQDNNNNNRSRQIKIGLKSPTRLHDEALFIVYSAVWRDALTSSEEIPVTAAFEVIDGIPTYNLYIGGQWTRASRDEATTSYDPATGEPYARVHQAGAAETQRAVTAAHETYESWADMIVSEVVTLTDCTAALSEEEQRLAVTKNYPMFSRPLSHAEFLAELGGKATGGGKSRGYEAA
jgi:hypothetical protein